MRVSRFSIFLQSAQAVRNSLNFLSSRLAVTDYLHVILITASRFPYIAKLIVKYMYLLCSTKKPFLLQHLSQLDAIFVSSGRMTSLFWIIPRFFRNRNSDSIERVFNNLGLFHLFLFRNKVNRTHPKLNYSALA